MGFTFLFLGLGAFILLVAAMLIITRYKRCPSNKILVIYGKTGQARSARCVAGGAAFVWPVIQSYEYLDLSPISIDIDLQGALSKQNIRVNVPSRFTVAVSNEPGVMINAAEHLLGKTMTEIREIAKDIIFGQLRLVVATMDIEEINADRDKFLSNVSQNVTTELKKFGLKLMNVNVTDIQDESGYIEALGKEAAAKAINDAKKSVAEKDRDGAIGQAEAHQDQRVRVSEANALAKVGEAAAQADAVEEAFKAETDAELARAAKEKASQEADIIVQTEIEKRKIELEAEAEAERIKRIAKGEAEALFLRKKAEADGLYEILKKQADGFNQIVEATNGNPREAVLMLIADKLPELVETQVEAIKNIKIDKVTVWENGSESSDGGNSTSKFISGLYKSVPPLNDLFNMAGMELPSYLGKQENEPLIGDSTSPEDE